MTVVQAILFGTQAIGKIVEAMAGAATGKITPEQCFAQIKNSTLQDAEVNEKAKGKLDEARQEIRDKFGEDKK